MEEEIKVTEPTKEVTESNNAPELVQTMINNGVTKEDLKEVLADFFKHETPAIDVEAASKDYFTSLLHGVK